MKTFPLNFFFSLIWLPFLPVTSKPIFAKALITFRPEITGRTTYITFTIVTMGASALAGFSISGSSKYSSSASLRFSKASSTFIPSVR